MREARNAGFTLVEMVVVIVLLGIVGAMTSQLILPLLTSYTESRVVDRLYGDAKFAVERIDREIRMSIPNSLRTVASDTGIQFGRLKDAAYYSDRPANNKHIELDATTYPTMAVGDQLSIYNTNPNQFYNGNRNYQIDTLLAGNVVELDRKPAPQSPLRRFYCFDLAQSPVTFYHSGTQLIRSFGYGLGGAIDGTAGGNVVATNVQSAAFSYDPGNMTRNATLKIDLTMAANGISLNYSHKIHIRNMP
ncbi:MAG: hypothetical protein C0618_12315 [Desulfuromonas sp.]|nr:MAG: hypothetical protein C0618_12315 [Desulfuromonas sp.]